MFDILLCWLRYLTNRFGKADPNDSQQVEWAYAFDIHLNAYFPTLIILHMVQVFLLHSQSSYFDVIR